MPKTIEMVYRDRHLEILFTLKRKAEAPSINTSSACDTARSLQLASYFSHKGLLLHHL